MPTQLLLSHSDLKALGINYSRAHLWRLQSAGLFPKPVKLTPTSRNCWSAAEIGAWIEERVNGRRP
jgi:prophage regulatory protein